MEKLILLLLFILVGFQEVVFAQQITPILSGVIIDAKKHGAIPFANIYCKELKTGAVSDIDGSFLFPFVISGSYHFQVSCIGYHQLDTIMHIDQDQMVRLPLKKQDQKLEEVVVIAQVSDSKSTGSVIKKDALTHLQPSSFADILELLPGGVSKENNMSVMSLISLRQPVEASSFYNDENTHNSSLGTSFMVDGVPLSNDGQLQNVTGSYTHSSSSDNYISFRNTTGKGIDMRAISTDDIESVEIIRGIPSVKYGDLSSGLVMIHRSYKELPFHVRLKADPGSKLISAGKGFRLNKRQVLNVNADYIDYQSDPRNSKVNYNRITGSLHFVNKPIAKEHGLFFKANVDYTGTFDGRKKDSQIDLPETDRYKDNFNKVRMGAMVDWYPEDLSWLKKVSGYLTGSYTHEEKTISKAVSGSNSPITTSRKEGEYYGEFLPSSYVAHLVVDGKPLYLFARFSSDMDFSFLGNTHQLLVGGDWRYNKNNGLGEVYDVTRPLYAGNGRPRASNELPSVQVLSFFAEDNVTIPIGSNDLSLQAGVRAARALNVGDAYRISDRFFFDPRINWSWRFPRFNVFSKAVSVQLNGGFGWHTKFPTLSHLYPNLLYCDVVQLNYFSQNKALRQLNYCTKIIDPTNYQLKPNRNRKWEIGFAVKAGRIRLDVTGYHELMESGFKRLSQYDFITYKRCDISTGPSPEELTAPPTLDMFEYEQRKEFLTHGKVVNGSEEEKYGIEYQLDLGKVAPIYSRVSMNGAWMRARYGMSMPTYRHPSKIINDETYPYLGYYTWGNNKAYEQFNTNVRFDTQFPEMGLIFSSMLQTMWFTKRSYTSHNGMPEYYIDNENNVYPYRLEDTTDPVLRFLYKKPDPDEFDEWVVPLAIDFNLKVTKVISKDMKLAFYVNSILDYHPSYSRKDGTRVNRKVYPYFGMEFNVNI
ncbi:hypothetical protein DMA11_21055 [Marinilabiliaceae bacterium JC017]|nr:hypothetical protein DMA11_21055 [Marinilabiliaceae bacterium JC017]